MAAAVRQRVTIVVLEEDVCRDGDKAASCCATIELSLKLTQADLIRLAVPID